ncbi:MAG: hypothetical protein KF915_18710 [Polyangiaceae bacterium]|nr:hypothetical protein [Polyangiaceae bacterium]
MPRSTLVRFVLNLSQRCRMAFFFASGTLCQSEGRAVKKMLRGSSLRCGQALGMVPLPN